MRPVSVSSSGVSPPPPRHCVDYYASVRSNNIQCRHLLLSGSSVLSSVWFSMESDRQNKTENTSRSGDQERSSKSIQTSCAGTEPYYRVPILQRVLSPAPGYSSALYSVQVMTQSEVDTMKSHQRSSHQVLTPHYVSSPSVRMYLSSKFHLKPPKFAFKDQVLHSHLYGKCFFAPC